jgi:small-conductance mechanosensitive channel
MASFCLRSSQALAVFSGAIGIGLVFGLQGIFSNLVAGIIMLFEGRI